MRFIPRSQFMLFVRSTRLKSQLKLYPLTLSTCTAGVTQEFDTMLQHLDEHLAAATDFFGLPRLEQPGAALKNKNGQKSRNKVTSVECATKAQLESFFGPWNEMLYATIAKHRSLAPGVEPGFPRFETTVPCTDTPQAVPAPDSSSPGPSGLVDAAGDSVGAASERLGRTRHRWTVIRAEPSP